MSNLGAVTDYNQTCVWGETAISMPALPALQDRISTDICIVGGGLTGVRTALGLAEAGVDTVLIEAGDVAWGASGRNGGQANPMWKDTPDCFRERFGTRIGDNLVAATLTGATDLFADIARLGIQCSPIQSGWAQVAHGPKSARFLDGLGSAWRAEGAKIRAMDAAEVASVTGAATYQFGQFHETAGQVQPLSLTRGFATAALAAGVNIFAHTPAIRLERVGAKWLVTTPSGQITAERVILATNAYSQGLHAGLAQTVLPMISILGATRVLTDDEMTQVLPKSVSLADTRRVIYYTRKTPDNRLAFGCIGSSENVRSFGGLSRIKTGIGKVFPILDGIDVPFHWSGRIATSTDFTPHLHEPEPGLTAALGYTGRGIVMTSVMAKTLVARALGADANDLPFPISPIQPMPFHWVKKTALPLIRPILAMQDKWDS